MANSDEQMRITRRHTEALQLLGGVSATEVSDALEDIRNFTGDPKYMRALAQGAITETYMPYISAGNILITDFYNENRRLFLGENLNIDFSKLNPFEARRATASMLTEVLSKSNWADGFDMFNKQIGRSLVSGMLMQNDSIIRSTGKQDKSFKAVERFARPGACSYCQKSAGEVAWSVYHKNCGCGAAPKFVL